jgi:type I restriction enzyme, S subunit
MTDVMSVTNQQINSISVDREYFDPYFIYYTLLTLAPLLKAHAGGAATPIINKSQFSGIEIQVPDLQTQRRIASILSAYDDLIENNTRRIAILEEMARRIFEEWFVHFRAPGCEGVPLVDSPLGPVPEGWEVSAISSIARFQRGRAYRSVELVETGGLPFVGLKCMDRGGGFRPDGAKRINVVPKPDHMVRSGDIIIALTDMTQQRLIVGRAAQIDRLDGDYGVLSMDLAKVVAYLPDDHWFCYGLLRWSKFPDIIKEFANGANVLHLPLERATQQFVVLPPSSIREVFAKQCTQLVRLQTVLSLQNANLRTQRDLLLPKLISGEIDVSDAGQRLEAAE